MNEALAEDSLHTSNERYHRERIAGITLEHIGDEPPYSSSERPGGYLGSLERLYSRAQRSFDDKGFEPTARGLWDERICTLPIEDETHTSPRYTFLVTEDLLGQIHEAKREKGTELSKNELLGICLGDGNGAVDPDFKADAMNVINATYYASEIAFDKSAKLATMFAENVPLNTALGSLMASSTSDGSTLRIKEISSGNNTGHWNYIAQGIRAVDDRRNIELTLTDFIEPVIASEISNSTLVVNSEVYSLFDDMPKLADENRFDTIISTYGFDSVWQPEDARLNLVEGQWYRTMYRVKVADWAPRREELMSAMRRVEPLPDSVASDYDGIVVETAMEPIDLSENPFYKYIAASGRKTIDFPGGLIRRVVDAFESQLKDDGIFISGDVGNFGFKKQLSSQADQMISGIAARYKIEDYTLAKQILEAEYGLQVDLISLQELADGFLPNDWRENCSTLEGEQIDRGFTNGVMVVRRQRVGTETTA